MIQFIITLVDQVFIPKQKKKQKETIYFASNSIASFMTPIIALV